MKKIALALTLLITAGTASAHGWERGYGGAYHGYHGGYHHGGGDWIAPAIIGGVVGYAIAQPRTVYVQPPVVYSYNQPQVIYQNCTAWIETQDQYGVITRTRTCQ